MVLFLRSSIDDVRNAIVEFRTEKLKQGLALEYLVRNITYLGAPKDIRLSNEDKIEYLTKILRSEEHTSELQSH